MRVHSIASAAMLVALIASPVSAAQRHDKKEPGVPLTRAMATRADTQRCTALEKRFDSMAKSHSFAASATEANVLRSDGGALCAAGRPADGIVKLEQALRDIGVRPGA